MTDEATTGATVLSDTTASVEPPEVRVVDFARAVLLAEADAEYVGHFLGAVPEDDVALTLSFAATLPGYRGWFWSVTLAAVENDPATISEITLLPGADALLPPAWVPWADRVRPGDLGAGDLLPAAVDDPRLVPGYVHSDDPAVEALATEVGLGRSQVLSRDGRLDAADRWEAGPFSALSEMAVQAPARCASCGFYLPLAGSLGTAFGACGNEHSPADGNVVPAAFGCGAHSDVRMEDFSAPAPANVVLDELRLEVHPHERDEPADLVPNGDEVPADAERVPLLAGPNER